MEDASLRYGPAMDSTASASLSRSFERHLRAKDLSDGTVASYLVGVRQFTAFLQPHGRELTDATRADLEAFVGDWVAGRQRVGPMMCCVVSFRPPRDRLPSMSSSGQAWRPQSPGRPHGSRWKPGAASALPRQPHTHRHGRREPSLLPAAQRGTVARPRSSLRPTRAFPLPTTG
jgi:hypothetical protein